jgi:hypothetical protein
MPTDGVQPVSNIREAQTLEKSKQLLVVHA